MRLSVTFIAAVSTALVLGSGPAHAKSPLTDINVFYRLYVGGGKLAEVDLSARLGKGRYTVKASAKSVGFLGDLAKVVMSGTSSGLIVGDAVRPVDHQYKIDERGRRKRQVVMAYSASGKPEVSAQPAFNRSSKRAPISVAQTVGTIDPVTSFVIPIKAGASALHPSQCKRGAAIFDGQQRYDISLKHKASYGAYNLKAANYVGPAIRCTVQFQPVAGYKKAGFLADLAKRKASIDVVYAPTGDGRYLIPVRIRFPTPIGQAVFQAINFSSKTVMRAAALSGN
ncbi:hypothetical protein MNBD_ALPHA09-2188 [hydrothermal vent metagenome]|uniref:DUF3108 domain-containing protein n=1 Tax=hydrothermal vent metagenome TaxID=652676 RepID=A0A3B0T0E3_9ZZZZ